jgi:cytochrome c553
MTEHFSKATDAKTAVVRGDLERARRAASSLAESEWTSNLRSDWRPYMRTMQDAAKSVANAVDSKQAAQGIGRIGEACASCHAAVGGPKVAVEEAPDAGSRTGFDPAQHVWAVDRMWVGLIGPSEQAWRRGSAVLVSAPFEPAVRIATREVPPEVAILSNRFHELGRRAQNVDVDRRGGVLGDVLATCATCHERLNVTLP